jgi:hypothetical protein
VLLAGRQRVHDEVISSARSTSAGCCVLTYATLCCHSRASSSLARRGLLWRSGVVVVVAASNMLLDGVAEVMDSRWRALLCQRPEKALAQLMTHILNRCALAQALPAAVRAEELVGTSGEMLVSIDLPSGYHFTKGANSRYEVVVEPAASAVSVDKWRGSLQGSGPSRIKFQRSGTVDPGTTLNVNCKVRAVSVMSRDVNPPSSITETGACAGARCHRKDLLLPAGGRLPI